eukprot:4304773-Ditylum_brightwellii.AAC.1
MVGVLADMAEKVAIKEVVEVVVMYTLESRVVLLLVPEAEQWMLQAMACLRQRVHLVGSAGFKGAYKTEVGSKKGVYVSDWVDCIVLCSGCGEYNWSCGANGVGDMWLAMASTVCKKLDMSLGWNAVWKNRKIGTYAHEPIHSIFLYVHNLRCPHLRTIAKNSPFGVTTFSRTHHSSGMRKNYAIYFKAMRIYIGSLMVVRQMAKGVLAELAPQFATW